MNWKSLFFFFFFLPTGLKNIQGGYKGPKPKKALVVDFISKNDAAVRSLPIFVGGFSLLAILLNRAFSGIALVTDAARFASSGMTPQFYVYYGDKHLKKTNLLFVFNVQLSIQSRHFGHCLGSDQHSCWISMVVNSAQKSFSGETSTLPCRPSCLLLIFS